MPISKKILKAVKKQYPHYSKKRQRKIAYGIYHKQKKAKQTGAFYFDKHGTKIYLPKKDTHMKKVNQRMK